MKTGLHTRKTTWKRRLEIESALKGQIRYIFYSAEKSHKSYQLILDDISDLVYNHKDLVFLPAYVRSGIQGYLFAYYDMFWTKVEWVHWYNGKFVGKNLPYGKDFKQELAESAHVYKGTEDIYTERKPA